MPKVFISHSSKDKDNYVRFVVDKLITNNGFHSVYYDEYTFEIGLPSMQEIINSLEKTNIFVILISNNSLESKWVKDELSLAYDLSNRMQIYPIIIDNGINYNDSRLPDWIRDFNLKFVSKPTKCATLITQRLIEISYQTHPRILEKSNIFVGRNDYIKQFEERIDDITSDTPIAFIVSGVDGIGRRTLLRHCLVKSNLFANSYTPIYLHLNHMQSIEDFIYQLVDTGLTEISDLSSLMSSTIYEKLDILKKLIISIQKCNEKIFIIDNGCIIDREGILSDWFLKLVDSIKNTNKITFGVISKFKLYLKESWKYQFIYNFQISELTKKEREGLLKRYLDFESISLSNDDFIFVSNLLNGYPDQVFYAVENIKQRSILYLKDHSYVLPEFNEKRVSTLLSEFERDPKALDFLILLSSFDYIDLTFIFDVVGNDDDYYKKLLNKFINLSICEYSGLGKEFVRTSDIVRDYIQRLSLKVPDNFKDKLQSKLEVFLKSPSINEQGVSEYLYNIKQALLNDKKIDEKIIIPSIYLNVMSELYSLRTRYSDVINFAYKALENENLIDTRIAFEIRYLLCLALAKTQNSELLKEVQKIKGIEHNFLLAFYYRQVGNNKKALEELFNCININKEYSRAKRELVQVYINLEEFTKALELAKENHEKYKDNPYHVQAYFACLIRNEKNDSNKNILSQLLNNLEQIKGDRAREMFLVCNAQFEAFYNDDEIEAKNYINQALNEYPNANYARAIQFDICAKFNNKENESKMKEIISYFEKHEKQRYHNFIIKAKATLMVKEKNIDEATDFFDKNIKNYTEEAKDKFKHKLFKYI